MKSTPGPWFPYESGNPHDPSEKYEIGVMNRDEQVICRSFEHEPNAEANAHLVATAPELLTVIEKAYLAVATVLNDLPVEAGHLANLLETAVDDMEQVLFKAKRAEGN